MEGDDRVEIELTPNAPRPRRRAQPPTEPDATDGAPLSMGTEAARWAMTPSRRTAVVAVGVGVGALTLGWIAGRATNDGPDDAAESPATAPPHTSVVTTAPGFVYSTLPTVDPTTTVRPTTTTVPSFETSRVDVHPILAGAPYELVGLDTVGNLVVLDLTTGVMTVRRDIEVAAGGGPGMLWAGVGWTLLPRWNTGDLVLVADGDDPVDTDLGPAWQVIESETPGQFWRVDDQVVAGQTGTAHLVNRHGERSGTRIELTEQPVFADPLGGLLVTSAGSTYRVDTDGVTKIADGAVVALDTERAFARVCDDELSCRYVVVDRETGEVTDTPFDPAIRYMSNMWPVTDATRIAPDGHTVAAWWLDPINAGEVLGLLDLESGSVTELSSAGYGGIRWSPDGRFAFYLDAGLPTAHELSTGESFVIAEGVPRLTGIALRPVSP